MLYLFQEFLTGKDFTNLFPVLEQSVNHWSKVKLKSSADKLKNVEEIINKSKDVKIIDIMSIEDFQEFLTEKRKRYNFLNKHDRLNCKTSVGFTLENIINSFCNPENISKVAEEFIKKSTLQ